MISFQQMCEMLTCNQRYSWFYFDKKYISFLTPEEVLSVKLDMIEGDFARIWYPRSKYNGRPMQQSEMKRLLMKALEEEDFVEAKRLKDKMKESKV